MTFNEYMETLGPDEWKQDDVESEQEQEFELDCSNTEYTCNYDCENCMWLKPKTYKK